MQAGASSSSTRSTMAADSKYTGVRKRKWGKWVSEVRLPNSRERIWLGSFDSPEKAARAFDAAQFCLRGRSARFNFPDNPPDIELGGRTLTSTDIQLAASRYANTVAEPSLSQQQQQQQEADGMMVEPPHAAEERDGEGEEEMSPSHSLSLSGGTTVQMDNNDVTVDGLNSYPHPYLDPVSSMGPESYASDYGLFTGFGDYDYGSQSVNFDYGGEEENSDVSYLEHSCLWSFER
ncbi:hypothetical protein Ancab_017865 [Ancistrocladus abbreviatus]